MILEPVSTSEQALIAREDAATLHQALQRLPARYERVLRLRYGIGCEPMIFKDIGAQIGVCTWRAQQVAREAERRLRMPLMRKFRERPGVQRYRRALDEARLAEARAHEFALEQRAINEERSRAAENERILLAAERREAERRENERMREAERQRQSTVAEILRIAEEVELELDQIPRQRKQRVVNPFGLSAGRASEYAEVLRALLLPHYRMRT